jgi:adenosylhomocysteine nucleosidase
MRTLAAVIASLLVAACGAQQSRPIVVQGAMEVEVRKLADTIDRPKEEKVAGWTFWTGSIDGYPVVVSKTLKGLANAAAATAIAAEHYRPAAIINQGTAGGHQSDLHVYDIVVGTEAVNLGSFKTGFRERGRGSELAEWKPLDLMRSDGSAGQDPNARTMRRFRADDQLLAAARRARDHYPQGRVVDGVIGSSEIWNSELDRIQSFHDQFGTTVEEMETASAAQIAGIFGVPFIGIRIVSNNITNGGSYDGKTAEACQLFVIDVVKRYVAGMRR